MRSLKDVSRGRIQRKDSLVTDSKFDDILASLQSLAEDLEKDYKAVSDKESEDERDRTADGTPGSSQLNSLDTYDSQHDSLSSHQHDSLSSHPHDSLTSRDTYDSLTNQHDSLSSQQDSLNGHQGSL